MDDRVAIYCDESCHLERDESIVMGLGAVWVSRAHVRNVSLQLRDIKRRHSAAGELKWTKVSNSKIDFYKEIIDWFFDNDSLHFRCLIVPDKTLLAHQKFNDGSHDNFYYKMYYSMLNKIAAPDCNNEIYIDIKDTRSNVKVKKLRDVLNYSKFDFSGSMISKVQQVRSHEIELMQLTDLLLGAVVYKHRALSSSSAKVFVADRIEKVGGRSVLYSSPLSNHKFNVFVWRPQRVDA